MIRTGATFEAIRTLEGYKSFKMERTASSGLRLASDAIQTPGNSIDVSWLPLCAEQYIISPDINDYIISDVPIVHADVPNRNLDEFPFEELTRFDPSVGRPVYQTFIGKPTHKDHDNKDPRKAKGVIFDARLEKDAATGLYAVRILAGYDRTKDPQLTDQILDGSRPGHSMGALVGYTMCSFPGCGVTSSTGSIPCKHMQGVAGKGQIVQGQLINERCYNVTFIENSSVDDRANWGAAQVWAR